MRFFFDFLLFVLFFLFWIYYFYWGDDGGVDAWVFFWSTNSKYPYTKKKIVLCTINTFRNSINSSPCHLVLKNPCCSKSIFMFICFFFSTLLYISFLVRVELMKNYIFSCSVLILPKRLIKEKKMFIYFTFISKSNRWGWIIIFDLSCFVLYLKEVKIFNNFDINNPIVLYFSTFLTFLSRQQPSHQNILITKMYPSFCLS